MVYKHAISTIVPARNVQIDDPLNVQNDDPLDEGGDGNR
jgi:hypothetical protein